MYSLPSLCALRSIIRVRTQVSLDFLQERRYKLPCLPLDRLTAGGCPRRLQVTFPR